jgi:hypothetical protein
MDYGPGPGQVDGLNRYWVWDYTGDATFQALALLPQEIVELQVMGEEFDPAQFRGHSEWFTPRDWGSES